MGQVNQWLTKWWLNAWSLVLEGIKWNIDLSNHDDAPLSFKLHMDQMILKQILTELGISSWIEISVLSIILLFLIFSSASCTDEYQIHNNATACENAASVPLMHLVRIFQLKSTLYDMENFIENYSTHVPLSFIILLQVKQLIRNTSCQTQMHINSIMTGDTSKTDELKGHDTVSPSCDLLIRFQR